ncbi:MAG: N-acetyltransferase [Streptococcaceae bacterium]|jgi:predicted N-acetyltransferase YhbS|nr:N-acetyltransferase [Streptococcaceae bacterium]
MENFNIRLETPSDDFAVENMTRDAFWNQIMNPTSKICDEHYLTHKIRRSSAYVPQLDFVAEIDGRIVGNIVYTQCQITKDNDIKHTMLTFGPLAVHPDFQNKGIGQALMKHSFEVARKLGYKAIFIFGHADYYPKVGFERAGEYGITASDGSTFDAFMVYPLLPNALKGIKGKLTIDPVFYSINEADVLEFDKQFRVKKRYIKKRISLLDGKISEGAKEAITELVFKFLDEMPFKSERELLELEGMTQKDIKIIKKIVREYGIMWGK